MESLVNISFPGFGIGEFTLNKIAFTLFGKLEVRWYGIIITLGIVLAFLYTMYRGKRNENVKPDDVIDIGILTVILGVIGARLYYVLNDKNGVYDSFLDVIAVWEGGLGIYGGIIGGALGIFIMCKFKKIKWVTLFDMAAPAVMLAQAIGRWGNFFNGEAYGYRIAETTKFYFFNKEFTLPSGEGTFFHFMRMGLTPNIESATVPYDFHPTFLYECVWNLIGFALINLFYKKKRFDGQIVLMYFTWYGFGRMFIEGFRTDSLYLPGTTLRVSQCLGLFFFVGGLTALLILFAMGKKNHQFMTVRETAPAAPVSEEIVAEEEDPAQKREKEEKATDAFLSHMTERKLNMLEKLSNQKRKKTSDPTPTATDGNGAAQEQTQEDKKDGDSH